MRQLNVEAFGPMLAGIPIIVVGGLVFLRVRNTFGALCLTGKFALVKFQTSARLLHLFKA